MGTTNSRRSSGIADVQGAPLAGVCVVDLGCYLAGPLAGMLLADQGANVVKIDPPSGPIFDHPINVMLNRNKSSCGLDLKRLDDLREAEQLIAKADILIDNFGPGVMDRLGLTQARLKSINSGLIRISMPGFSQVGQISAETKAYEGIVAAATGQFTDIHTVRQSFGLPPVYTALPIASVYAAVHAATAAVLALRERRAGHEVSPIRCPLDAAALSAMSNIFMKIEDEPERYVTPRLPAPVRRLVLPLMKLWARSGPLAQAKLLGVARKAYPALMSSFECEDGNLLYIFAIDNLKLARRTIEALGILQELESAGLRFENPYRSGDRRDNLGESSNLSRSWQARIKHSIATVLRTRPAAEWEDKLTLSGVPCAMHRTTQEWLALPELKQAGVIVEVGAKADGMVTQPGLQVWLSNSPPDLARPDSSWPLDRSKVDNAANAAKQATGLGPPIPPGNWLKGTTVVDLCSMVAGPVAGRTLAEYGARVIKIETPAPHHGPRMTCWYGLDVNQGKESILVDLKVEEGRAFLAQVLSEADILLTNQPRNVLEQFELDDASIQRRYPTLIHARIGAFNGPREGLWSTRNGYDPVLQAAAGIMTRYGDEGHPELHGVASCVDALTGFSAMFGIAMALNRRDQEQQGRSVDASLAAAATLVQLPFALGASNSSPEPSGQACSGVSPNYRLYQARDGWIFVAARPDQLGEMLAILGASELADRGAEEAIERTIRAQPADHWLALLNSHAIAVTRVNAVAELREVLSEPDQGRGLSLRWRNAEGLGPVLSAPPLHVQTDLGGLRHVKTAQKPGTSTRSLLEEFGVNSGQLIDSGVATEGLSDEFLPS